MGWKEAGQLIVTRTRERDQEQARHVRSRAPDARRDRSEHLGVRRSDHQGDERLRRASVHRTIEHHDAERSPRGAPTSARSTFPCSSSRSPPERALDEPLAALDAALGGALGRAARASRLSRRPRRDAASRRRRHRAARACCSSGIGKATDRAAALRRAGALAARQARTHGRRPSSRSTPARSTAAKSKPLARRSGRRRVGLHGHQDPAARRRAARSAHRRAHPRRRRHARDAALRAARRSPKDMRSRARSG